MSVTHSRTARLLLLSAFLFPSVCLPALNDELRSRLPPETTDVRRDFSEYVIAPLVELIRLREATRYSRDSAMNVQVSTPRSDDHVYLVFVPETSGEFRLDTAGTFILRRRRDNGRIDQLKIFLRSDERFFVRITPVSGDRSMMSVFLAGSATQTDVPVPYGIETIMETPLAGLLEATSSLVDWETFYPDIERARYTPVQIMAERTRAALPTLPDAEDGAMDENGRLVFIESLVLQDQQPGFNCSGFAKWVVDGLFMPRFGSFLEIEPLKEKHPELRGHRWSNAREDDRDPYFGLDWTRNLATAVLSAEEGGREVHPEAADVREVRYSSYVEDIGYPVERLEQILYLLAIQEPGWFYLASFSREFGEDPVLNQHVHVAVLFPYFDEDGGFHAVVMERNVESSVESLVQRYGSDHVHLVRVRAHQSFTPPLVLN
jgi:hypothetical protein